MNMTPNVAEAIRALTEKPMLATTAERFLILDEIKSAHKELSHPLRFSWMLSHLLSRVSVPLAPYDLIAGRTVDRLLTEEEAVRFHDFVHHEDFHDGKSFLSSGHMTYSWEAVIELGIPGLRKMAESQLAVATDSEARDYIQATIEIHDAVIAYMLRYADAAEEAGLLSVSKNLRMGTRRAPVHFAEALQLLWIITLIDCAYVTENPTLTLGRLDQILYPLYQKDLADRVITEEEARAYITDYYCKHNLIMGRGEHQVGDAQNSTTFCRILNFDAPQYLLLAGVDAEGNAALNPLTELFAECIVPSFKNPVVVVRYVRGMDKTAPSLWKTLIDKAIASASMMFYNDKNVYDTWRRMGLPEADARRAHTPFSQNIRPSNGVCTSGLTAMLSDLLCLPADGLLSGALNLDVDRKQFSTREGRAAFEALLASYFNRGGLHAQISSLTLSELLQAQENPDAHRDLRVRVTGYSGVFVDICPRLQNDIIKRFE